jgi:hypothetical protein
MKLNFGSMESRSQTSITIKAIHLGIKPPVAAIQINKDMVQPIPETGVTQVRA